MGEIKRIKVSSKRQITIPIEFYNQLGITGEKEVECFINDAGEMVIRPERANEFGAEILRDLLDQGYEKEQLYRKFIEMSQKIRPAAQLMIAEAEEAAKNYDGIDRTEEIFGR